MTRKDYQRLANIACQLHGRIDPDARKAVIEAMADELAKDLNFDVTKFYIACSRVVEDA